MTFPPIAMLKQLVRHECRQRREEGCDVGDIPQRVAEAGEGRDLLMGLYEQLRRLEVRPDFPFEEPNELDAIRAARPAGLTTNSGAIKIDKLVDDRLHGGCLGRCAGCALGKPLESPPFMTDARNIKRYLEFTSSWPLNNYISCNEEACRAVGLDEMHSRRSQREHIRYMEPDDDIRYTIMGLDILAEIGSRFTTRDVADWWLQKLGAARCYTAEEAVYRNLILLGATHDVATLTDEQLAEARDWLNPYREWIGAQIRAAGWALACPADPQRAALFAWRDATLSHVKNGVYGEMYCAAMIAAAAALNEPREIVSAGLAQIPERSRLADAIRRTMEYCRSIDFSADRFEDAIHWLWEQFGDYDPVHSINNAAAVTAALLLGGRDFEKVITIAVMSGWDTDCNGATAGSVCGTMLGAQRLPDKWTRPLNDVLLGEIPGFHPLPISKCARRHAKIARQLASGDG